MMRLKLNHSPNAGSVGPIGLDIGAMRIKAVQLTDTPGAAHGRTPGSGASPALVASLLLDRVDPGGTLSSLDAQRLAAGLRRRGFRGRRIVTAAPRNATRTGLLQLPPNLPADALGRVAGVELARTHKIEANAMEVACWPIPVASHGGRPITGNATTATMAVGCDHDTADGLIDLLEAQALAVVGLDLEALALARACEPLVDKEPGIVAAVDLGHDAAAFVLLHHGLVVYERKLSGCGTKALYEAIHDEHDFADQVVDYAVFELGFELEERGEPGDDRAFAPMRPQLDAHFSSVARELNLSMQYAAHQYPDEQVTRLMLTGGGAAVPGAAERVGQSLDAPARTLRLGDIARCTDGFEDDADSTALTLAAGLARYPREAMR